jgi:hypothetical protein
LVRGRQVIGERENAASIGDDEDDWLGWGIGVMSWIGEIGDQGNVVGR